ncbi:MAG: hypothetical protein QOG60_923 [Frankiaceae bacterium]|nr:hypothetical protein [Frankiaceae bacterium]
MVRPALWVPTFQARLVAVRLSLTIPGRPKDWCFSHTTAARLRNFAVPRSDGIHVLLPTSRPWPDLRDVVRHVTKAPHVGVRVGKEPVTSLADTVLQCATVLSFDDLLALIEDLLRRELTTMEILRSTLGRGRSGSARLRDALDVLDDEGTDRWMRRLVRLVVGDGLPAPELEYPIREGHRLLAVLDGYFPDAAVALEVDDWATHGSRDASERDRRRDARLLSRFGITTIRTTPREIRRRPAGLVEDIRLTYERALRGRRAAS